MLSRNGLRGAFPGLVTASPGSQNLACHRSAARERKIARDRRFDASEQFTQKSEKRNTYPHADDSGSQEWRKRNLAHLAFLKELSDNLAAPPYERQVSLCLVTAHIGATIPLKEIFSRPDTLWRQFRRRLDTERPFCVVAGHTEEEVRSILAAFEDLYRSQLPDLQLCRWTKSIFIWLTHATLDPDGSKRVTMDHLTRLVTSVLRRSYEQGGRDVDAAILAATAERMILRRDEIVEISGLPSERILEITEVE